MSETYVLLNCQKKYQMSETVPDEHCTHSLAAFFDQNFEKLNKGTYSSWRRWPHLECHIRAMSATVGILFGHNLDDR